VWPASVEIHDTQAHWNSLWPNQFCVSVPERVWLFVFVEHFHRYTRGNKPVLATPLPEGCSIPNYNFNYSHDGELVCAGSEPEVIIGGKDKKSFVSFFVDLVLFS
jgi:hypothetical protein